MQAASERYASSPRRIPAALAVAVATVCCLTGTAAAAGGNFSFTIANDRFVKDGQPVQLISGA